MGYFSNGSEGDDYMARYCARCVEWCDRGDGGGVGCPVMDLHLAHNYDAVGNDQLTGILDGFIPRKGTANGECRMFVEKI